MKLEYDSPGATWREALPIGNGRLGAMVFGAPAGNFRSSDSKDSWQHSATEDRARRTAAS